MQLLGTTGGVFGNSRLLSSLDFITFLERTGVRLFNA